MNCHGSRGNLSQPCRGIDATLHANGGDEGVLLWLPDAGHPLISSGRQKSILLIVLGEPLPGLRVIPSIRLQRQS